MALTAELSPDGQIMTLKVSGRFDFKLHKDFHEAYAKSSHPVTSYCIDLGQTDYLDSSALGMLLLLRKHAGDDRADIRIMNCSPVVGRILSIANFDKLFTVHP